MRDALIAIAITIALIILGGVIFLAASPILLGDPGWEGVVIENRTDQKIFIYADGGGSLHPGEPAYTVDPHTMFETSLQCRGAKLVLTARTSSGRIVSSMDFSEDCENPWVIEEPPR